MAQFQAQFYVLHATPFKETSALVTGLSEEMGKIRFVAKGVYSDKNKFKGLLQTFTLLSVRLTGRGELKTGISLEALSSSMSLQGKHLYCAMYCNELLNRMLVVEEPCGDVFERYQQVLHLLSEGIEAEPVLRQFELFLIQEMGAAYDFYYDCLTQLPIEPELHYQFLTESGFSHASKIASPRAFKGQHLLEIADGNWTAENLKTAKRFSRLALYPWLGNKPLKSRELFTRQG